MKYRLGLPMWANPAWANGFFSHGSSSKDYLAQYASVFNAVEANTTFYATPSAEQVQSWLQATSRHDFRFSCKLPKTITHIAQLQHCQHELQLFFQRMEPLKAKLGPVMIQLPPSFSAQHLADLQNFIKLLPASFQYSVEVRHTDFFHTEADSSLNELLAKYRIDRVMFDTRALFASTCDDVASLDAKAKKPNFPAVACALGKHPILRFMGSPVMADSAEYFAPWVEQIKQWIAQGREPYIFMHMADNRFAPALAAMLHQQLQQAMPELADLPRPPCERDADNGQLGLF